MPQAKDWVWLCGQKLVQQTGQARLARGPNLG